MATVVVRRDAPIQSCLNSSRMPMWIATCMRRVTLLLGGHSNRNSQLTLRNFGRVDRFLQVTLAENGRSDHKKQVQLVSKGVFLTKIGSRQPCTRATPLCEVGRITFPTVTVPSKASALHFPVTSLLYRASRQGIARQPLP